jgi:hypothetical protein
MGPVKNKGEPVGMGNRVGKKVGQGENQGAAVFYDVVKIKEAVPKPAGPSIGGRSQMISQPIAKFKPLVPAGVVNDVDIKEGGEPLQGMATKKSKNGKKVVQGAQMKNDVLNPVLYVAKPVGKNAWKVKGQHGCREGPMVETAVVIDGNLGKLKELHIGGVEGN